MVRFIKSLYSSAVNTVEILEKATEAANEAVDGWLEEMEENRELLAESEKEIKLLEIESEKTKATIKAERIRQKLEKARARAERRSGRTNN